MNIGLAAIVPRIGFPLILLYLSQRRPGHYMFKLQLKCLSIKILSSYDWKKQRRERIHVYLHLCYFFMEYTMHLETARQILKILVVQIFILQLDSTIRNYRLKSQKKHKKQTKSHIKENTQIKPFTPFLFLF